MTVHDARITFERGFSALLVRFGARDEVALAEEVTQAVDTMLAALGESAQDGQSLSPLDVVRIRAGKFAAARVPAAVFRDPKQLSALRAEIMQLALAWLGPEARRGSRF